MYVAFARFICFTGWVQCSLFEIKVCSAIVGIDHCTVLFFYLVVGLVGTRICIGLCALRSNSHSRHISLFMEIVKIQVVCVCVCV